MITKALPIPVVTPFPIFRGQYALSLPFIFAKATSRACIFICTVGDCPRLNASAFGLSTLWLRSPGAAGQVEIKKHKKNSLKREDARHLLCLAFIMKKFIQK